MAAIGYKIAAMGRSYRNSPCIPFLMPVFLPVRNKNRHAPLVPDTLNAKKASLMRLAFFSPFRA